MDEAEFVKHAEEMLTRIETLIEGSIDQLDLDVDIELQEGGILKLEFENASQIIINRHAAAQEIWVAARSGGFHFRWTGDEWIGTRDGREILACLGELISQQTGRRVVLG